MTFFKPNPLALLSLRASLGERSGWRENRIIQGQAGLQQDAENNLSRRFRLANILNVPQGGMLPVGLLRPSETLCLSILEKEGASSR